MARQILERSAKQTYTSCAASLGQRRCKFALFKGSSHEVGVVESLVESVVLGVVECVVEGDV
jgi:hypothetical protein